MKRNLFEQRELNFNITAVIDIVFLLIIFFMVVCQFITSDNFEVAVPDEVTSANEPVQGKQHNPTVTVMLDDGKIAYAVDAEIIHADGSELSDAIAFAIDQKFYQANDERIVSLRIDKDICYSRCQHALAGVSKSIATGMELAVAKRDRF